MGMSAFNRARKVAQNKQEPFLTTCTEPEQGETLAPAVSEEATDYNELDDETLAALAAERQIDITDKTRRQVINLLKKAE